MTLGSGGWNGVGLGGGWQKLSFLPEANTDFVYAVIGEELGLVGTLGVLGLWAGLYWCGQQLFRARLTSHCLCGGAAGERPAVLALLRPFSA